jgi:hypothetical protein
MEHECKDNFKNITEHMNKTNVLLERYNSSLEQHMKRTDLLEKAVTKLDERSYSLSLKLYMLVGVLAVIQPIVLFLLRG